MDLSLVPIEDIIKELKRRYDAFVFAGTRNLDQKTGECEAVVRGGIVQELGLVEVLRQKLKNDMQDVVENLGEGEELGAD